MDNEQRTHRWRAARESYTVAQYLFQQGFYGASVSRSYYACFQAMWAAIGDPPRARWEHRGLIRTFCRGRWADPIVLPTSLAGLYKALLTLYDLRLDADYRAAPVTREKAQDAERTVTGLFDLIVRHTSIERQNP